MSQILTRFPGAREDGLSGFPSRWFRAFHQPRSLAHTRAPAERSKRVPKTFVLIHGASHGAWCWYKVSAHLRAAGHHVIALDLPGHGVDKTPLTQVSLDAYVAAVVEVLAPLETPVVLCGHSMGGVVISQVAEQVPEKIACLVYLAAALLSSGTSMLDALGDNVTSVLQRSTVMDASGASFTMRSEEAVELFYHDCAPEDIILAQSLLTPQAIAPLSTPLRLSESYEQVQRVYIETLSDRTIPLDQQRAMRMNMPCDQVFSLDTGHTPFFSASGQLVDCLLAV